MIEYEYRCRECGEHRTLSRVEKNLLSEERLRYLACRVCPGRMRRVWGGSVLTRSTPGFYAHENMAKAPD